jgi:hypothetical protein
MHSWRNEVLWTQARRTAWVWLQMDIRGRREIIPAIGQILVEDGAILRRKWVWSGCICACSRKGEVL